MRHLLLGSFFLLMPLTSLAQSAGEGSGKPSPREALRSFNDLIGSWRGTGMPEGTRDRQKDFWIESLNWQWRFRGDDAWLAVSFDKGKYFASGELRYLPKKDVFRFSTATLSKERQVYEGRLKDRILTVERTDAKSKEVQRLVFTFLHANRFLYRYEVKPKDRSLFVRRYQVGATKEGVPFAGRGDSSPECVVSGGLGTTQVSYKGQSYYVCCSGCREAFKEEPEKYIKEYEARKAKEAKERNP